MIYDRSDQNVVETLRGKIEGELSRIGLLFRVFARAKTPPSISRKLQTKNYGPGPDQRKIQDLYGIRLALYFPDDSTLAQRALKNIFAWDQKSSTIDAPSDATFGPTRCNLIFRLPSDLAKQSTTLTNEKRIDATFEVQFRTVFSEGWHEVEHDLRYKCKDDWLDHADLNRAMNGFIATLETCDWAMIKLFEELAWRHYKAEEWMPMLRTKFRLRFQTDSLDQPLLAVLNNDHDFAKALFRVDRSSIVERVFENKIDLPITPSNLIYIANHFHEWSENVTKITPMPVLEELRSAAPR